MVAHFLDFRGLVCKEVTHLRRYKFSQKTLLVRTRTVTSVSIDIANSRQMSRDRNRAFLPWRVHPTRVWMVVAFPCTTSTPFKLQPHPTHKSEPPEAVGELGCVHKYAAPSQHQRQRFLEPMPAPYIYPAANFQPMPYLKSSPYLPAAPFIPSPFTFPVPTALLYAKSITPIDDSPYYALWNAGVPQNAFSKPSWLPHYRRRARSFEGISSSWDDSPYSPWDYHGTAHHALLHPLLDGDSTSNDLYFDLASPTFLPMRALSTGQFVLLSSSDRSQPATTPALTRMRVVHHSIPQWPIDVEPRYKDHGPGPAPPITVGDVLYTIHRSLRKRTSDADWALLSHRKQREVIRAYTRRYSRVPQMGQLEASKGVMRVDYLGDRHIFRGLVRSHDVDGLHCWRMIS